MQQSQVTTSDTRHGPVPGVDDAITHLAALTAQRDRELLDVTLAQGVLDLLGAASVAVYRLIGREDESRRWLCCGLSRKGSLTVSDPMWVDLHQLPLEEEYPHRQRALSSRLPEHDEEQIMGHGEHAVLARHIVTLPLPVEVGLPGVLEVGSTEPLSVQAMRTVQTLLKVFGNFQNLLESSQRDALTSLLNRQTFDATFLKASMPLAERKAGHAQGERRHNSAAGYWLGVIDIDNFKRVNDNFGHLIGDEVLVLVARIMRQTFRHYDRLYRFGGEEFVVLLRGGTEADAMGAFERFRRNVASYPFPQVERVTVSVGFTEVMHHDTPNVTFSRADQAVYRAKHQGRDQVLCHEALVRDGVMASSEQHIGDVELF
ncbi:diguanylate cyclase [Aquabacterium sp.]|uniref:GGDEF domain-containing protein n=1 Tax=Aquabacterium sp. TaxID=1872578 RepID=UPI0024893F06|nr:GGDEF domain-containing protein [Aquabacterium sp.]MDI1348643.1 GGDEF domain-containing protein [Aquabacterium sp.]